MLSEKNLQEMIQRYRKRGLQMPLIAGTQGMTISVQASSSHYCHPRNNSGPWRNVEMLVTGATDEDVQMLQDYYWEGVYCEVPIELAVEFINKHDGTFKGTDTTNQMKDHPRVWLAYRPTIVRLPEHLPHDQRFDVYVKGSTNMVVGPMLYCGMEIDKILAYPHEHWTFEREAPGGRFEAKQILPDKSEMEMMIDARGLIAPPAIEAIKAILRTNFDGNSDEHRARLGDGTELLQLVAMKTGLVSVRTRVKLPLPNEKQVESLWSYTVELAAFAKFVHERGGIFPVSRIEKVEPATRLTISCQGEDDI